MHNAQIQNDLDAIVDKINLLLPQARIYLFGSHATGMHKECSDIDICIVSPTYHERRMEVLCSIRLAIRGVTKLPVDILAFTDDEFEHKSKMRPTIQYAIANEGVLLNG